MKQTHRTHRRKNALLLAAMPIGLLLSANEARAQGPGSSSHYLHGGTSVPVGQLEAIGRLSSSIGGCTATLITDRLVLTAAHCVCSDTSPAVCGSRATFTFINVRRVDNPNTAVDESAIRQDVSIQGDVSAHPQFNIGGWLINDYAVLRLDERASDLVLNVSPIAVERPNKKPQIGETMKLVGFGRTGENCTSPSAGKRQISVQVSEVSDVTIRFNNSERYSCPGDSGGPALNSDGNIVGVASSANFSTQSNYDPTYVAYPWLFGTGRILYAVGRVTYLRVHDAGTGYGHPTDAIDGEVVIKLDTRPDSAFGFPLRAGSNEPISRQKLNLLRDAFIKNKTLRVEYEVTGPQNGRIWRVLALP